MGGGREEAMNERENMGEDRRREKEEKWEEE